MDKSLELTLNSYFNDGLKKSLGYGDSFLHSVYNSSQDIIFFKNSNRIFQLGNILKSNPDLVSQLKSVLISLLEKYYKDLSYVKLQFNDQGFGIVLIRGEYMSKLEKQNIDTYVNIIRNLDTVEAIDQLCRSSKDINKVCKSEELWRQLIKSIYNFRYKHRYNYERLYKEYLVYRTYDKAPDSLYPYVSNFKHFNDIWYFIRFIFNEGILPPKDYDMFDAATLYMGDRELFELIIKYCSESNKGGCHNITESLEYGIIEALDRVDPEQIINAIKTIDGIIYKGKNLTQDFIYKLLLALNDISKYDTELLITIRENSKFEQAIVYAISKASSKDYDLINSVKYAFHIKS
jgi:hypothetical protein